MKNFITFFLGLMILSSLDAQDNLYYWCNGQKYLLKQESTKEFIRLKTEYGKTELLNILGSNVDSLIEIKKSSVLINLIDPEPVTYNYAIIRKVNRDRLEISNQENILYNAPYFSSKNGLEFGITSFFYVKLKSQDDFDILKTYADKAKVTIVDQNIYNPRWYTLECSSKSDGNSLECANSFYESGHFEEAQPNFIEAIYPANSPPNDPYFSYQWGLYNTGQYQGITGVDIKALDAWDITHGDENVIVAIFDTGIEPDHPDSPNLLPNSFDTYTRTSPNQYYDKHGTSVAGIVAAKTDNYSGIAGIASNSSVMDIRDDMGGAQYQDEKDLQAGFYYAVSNDVDVINCSWVFRTNSALINDGINHALENGRDGLGCIVVFASGNGDFDEIDYPGKANQNIITVGAANFVGKRKKRYNSEDTEDWGSNYGQELDLVAPSPLIPSIDQMGSPGYNPYSGYSCYHDAKDGTLVSSDILNDDYTAQFSGTSAAAPHVSGAAALILSVNSGLTCGEVEDILESTAQKVGPYSYQTIPGRPNGSWIKYVGYGLVDAGAAVQSAVCDHIIENTNYSSDVTISDCSSIEMDNVTVEGYTRLEINNVADVSISGPFEVEYRGKFHINNANSITINGPFEAGIGTKIEFNN